MHVVTLGADSASRTNRVGCRFDRCSKSSGYQIKLCRRRWWMADDGGDVVGQDCDQ